MANGDKAAALGWTTFPPTQNRSQGYDNDNYALDRAAEARIDLRDKVLPAINQPVFAAQRSTSFTGGIVQHRTWTVMPAEAWAKPLLNTGFASWSAGRLKIQLDGVYRVQAHVQFSVADVYQEVGIQLVRNTSTENTEKTLAKKHDRAVSSADCHGLVRLVAGDDLVLLLFQANAGGGPTNVPYSAVDLTWSMEWVRA